MGCGSSNTVTVKEKQVASDVPKVETGKQPQQAWTSPVPTAPPPPRKIEEDAGGVELPEEWTKSNGQAAGQKGSQQKQRQKAQQPAGKSIFGWFLGDGKPKDAAAPKAKEAAQAKAAVAEREEQPAVVAAAETRPWQQRPSVATWLVPRRLEAQAADGA
mmetsp:Transcript_148058/g.369100  ORF Transcript_148058/g.369100 Transcript_148058/m.369100 type:complete len:159 (-) Transcript_148058:71-547(-)|eukprot:CAMPEP_0115223742 /NCGR_PEP_ID=MMETSP0270-20121206/29203_1 /TAXON_ID=71861 /ORGANISM="Scrippsiella trochoidea, Strain CCMP3099" /LENGTH=158 /DNA_ID=CAMNT_0002638005 /DNA_START=78 /DNA_END=554 /DNA_ORIENTATION=+